MATGVVVLLALYTSCGFPAPGKLLRMVLRLRWLLLAILLVYGWWTPGTTLFPVMGSWSPSAEGMFTGLLRVLSLLLIVAAVHLLLQLTGRNDLLSAIMQLISPVTSEAGRARIAVRILLTLEAVTEVQPLVSDALKQRPLKGYNPASLGISAQHLYRTVLERAELSGGEIIEVPAPAAPPVWQWLAPAGLLLVVWLGF